ncbi:putative MFS family arabinose efflux permease [Micromonospora pisi]|uniref:Putative MFS family arabinose efflux permease n=1 Tax=Micromonospora pisi TaxID=589240 RepID=A0A495JK52_9ACTN|nr:MFS transporter [Micromonospora pisi]RKR89440.1 putative MFS family arabinose efflux permease [Micromonospora pisi]
MTSTGAAFAPLRYVPFRYLVTGRFISVLGNAIAPIALAFAVLDLTGSVRDLGLVVGARSVANVVFLLFGGVIADRLPRQAVMVASSALAAVTQGAVAALVLTHNATILLLIVLSAINGMVSAFAHPATAALMPQTVPAALLQPANALSRLGVNAGSIGGASVGGILVAVVGPGWGIAVDALSFALAGLAFAGVRVTAVRDRSVARRSTWIELREGWTEFSSRTWVWAVVLGFMVLNAALTSGLNVLGPSVADDGIGRRAWGLVLAAETAGMIVGALVALRLRVRRLLLLGVVSMLGGAPLLLVLGTVPHFVPLLLAAFVGGIALEQFGVAWETSMQQNIPSDKLARVYSYDMLGSFVAIPIGQIAVGPVALAIGTESTLLVAAGLVVLSVLGMLASRDVRRLETRTLPADAPESPVGASA